MSKQINTPSYIKKKILIPNNYPSFELEWQFFGNESTMTIDVFSDWFLATQMMAVRKIVNGKKLSESEQFINERIRENCQGDYVGYLYRKLLFKYQGRAEYESDNNQEEDFYRKIEKHKDAIGVKINNFIHLR
jgi:hypothetical protein